MLFRAACFHHSSALACDDEPDIHRNSERSRLVTSDSSEAFHIKRLDTSKTSENMSSISEAFNALESIEDVAGARLFLKCSGLRPALPQTFHWFHLRVPLQHLWLLHLAASIVLSRAF